MSDLQLMLDFFAPLDQLGPGGPALTRALLQRTGLRGRADLRAADLGCGTGASAVVLADELRAQVTAVDLAAPLLERVVERARAAGVEDRVTTLPASMLELPLPPGSLDLVWCEAAVYSVGFGAAVQSWRPLLTREGVLGVSDLVWASDDPPAPLRAYWASEYPGMATAAARRTALEEAGYRVDHEEVLPASAWEAYFSPVRDRIPGFLAEKDHSAQATALCAAMASEADLCLSNLDHLAYVFWLASPAR